MKRPDRLTILAPVAAVAGGVLLLALGLALAGYDAGAALAALARGAVGSWYAISSATLPRAVPLILIGLGFAFAFRAGGLNIGAEGQFYAGAIAATWVGIQASALPGIVAVPIVCAAAAVAGLLWIAIPVWLRTRFGVMEVITTLLLNFVAEQLVSLLVQGPLQESQHIYPQSDAIALSARLPAIPGTRLHVGLLLAVVAAGGLWYLFRRTWWGFELLAVGRGARAAEVSGRINVTRTVGMALLVSGAFAGLAGGVEVAGVSFALYPNLSPGYGFTGIAVALLARLHPAAIVLTGVLFGALEAGAAAMQRDAGIPAVIVYVVEAVMIIAILLADAASRRQITQTVLPERGESTDSVGVVS